MPEKRPNQPASIMAGFINGLGLAYLFFAFHVFCRSGIGAMAGTLSYAFSLDATSIGMISSAYYVACVACEIPFGYLLDAWGPKKTLRISMVLCVLGLALFFTASSFGGMMAGRILLGMSGASVFLASMSLSMLWLPRNLSGVASGMVTAIGKVGGGMLASFLLPVLIQKYTWAYIGLSLCVIGTLVLIASFRYLSDGPSDTFETKKASFRRFASSSLKAFKYPVVWAMGIYGYAMYLVLSVFGETYAIDFLMQSSGISRQQAGFLSSLAFLGSASGSVIMSYASDRLHIRKTLLCIGAFGALCFSGVVFFIPHIPYSYLVGSIFLFGFFSGTGILVFVTAIEASGTCTPGTLMGAVNSLVMSSGMVHNAICGFIIDCIRRYWPTYATGVMEYRISFSTITLMLLIALIIALSFSEKPRASLSTQG